MRKRTLEIGCSWIVTTFLIAGPICSAAATRSGAPLSGRGTANIDGVMSPGEWDGAAQLAFSANLPEGGTAPATLLVMNDGVNLYIAARVPRSQLEEVQFILEFDNDNDEIAPENGDDSVGLVLRPGSASFLDNYRTNEPPCPPGHPPGFCGPSDTSGGGTKDGQGLGSNDGSFSFVELSHPLDSADDLHDFSLAPGSTVGFNCIFSLCPDTGPCGVKLLNDDILIAGSDFTVGLTSNTLGVYHTGESAILSVRINNQGVPSIVDLFFGLLLFDGHTVLYFKDLAFNVGLADISGLSSMSPIVSALDLSVPFDLTVSSFFSYRWQGTEPPGSYMAFLVALVPGALADNRIDPGELLGASTTPLVFSP